MTGALVTNIKETPMTKERRAAGKNHEIQAKGNTMGKALLWLEAEEREEIARELFEVKKKRGEWLDGLNPFMEEQDPSFSYNFQKDYYKMLNSDECGDLIDLYSKVNGHRRREGLKAFQEKYLEQVDLQDDNNEPQLPIIKRKYSVASGLVLPEVEIFTHHLEPLEPHHVFLLQKTRGWSSETVHEHRLWLFREKNGRKRLAIPIWCGNELVNVRLYNSNLAPKLRSWAEWSDAPRLFPDREYIKPDEPLLICKGESDTLCARSFGLNAFTFTGSCGSIPEHLLECFRDLTVVIAYDGNLLGQASAEKLAETLLKVTSNVQTVAWPTTMDRGQDLTDFFLRHDGTVELLGELATPFTNRKEPYPLRRRLAPAPEFPVNALPPVLRNTVLYLCETIQCPRSVAAQSLLAVASLAVQAHVNVQLDGRIYPTSNFFVTIASSGERKTATDSIALAPVRAHEEVLRFWAKSKQVQLQAQQAAWEKARNEALSCKANDTMELKTQALVALGDRPQMLLDDMLTTEEPTYEGIVTKLETGLPTLGIFSDEGARFLGGAAMSSDNYVKTAAGLSKLWDGDPITRTRVKGGSFTLAERRTSMHLMIQPMVAETLLGNEKLHDQGLLSRVLLSRPESTIGSRIYRESDMSNASEIHWYHDVISSILTRPLPIKDGTINELNPAKLSVSPEAKAKWIEFHDRVELALGEGGKLFPVRNFAAKVAGHAARLAGVMSFIVNPDVQEIPEEQMIAGISLAEYYLAEAIRLHGDTEQADLVLAERCLKFLREKYPTFSQIELYQKGPQAVRTKAAAEKVVALLEEHGYVVKVEGGARICGQKRANAWRVVEFSGGDDL